MKEPTTFEAHQLPIFSADVLEWLANLIMRMKVPCLAPNARELVEVGKSAAKSIADQGQFLSDPVDWQEPALDWLISICEGAKADLLAEDALTQIAMVKKAHYQLVAKREKNERRRTGSVFLRDLGLLPPLEKKSD